MFEQILTALISGGAAAAVIGFLGKSWVEARVKASVEDEYKRQFELFSRGLDRKEKVELVAHVLAEFLKVPKGEPMSREQRLLQNRLSFMCAIWLPSHLAIELSKRLQNKPDAKTVFEIILLARKELLNDASLAVEHVTFWEPVLETRGDPVIR
jgi:hypothetical protein